MNHKTKIKHMRKFINQYGTIIEEGKNLPNKAFPPYRKGSYYVAFDSYDGEMVSSVGDKNKYETYKELTKIIKKILV